MPSFRQLFAGNELVRVFSVGRLVHPVVFDMYGLIGGFHGCWLDQEHAGVSYEQIVLASACARANNFDTFVRMAYTNYAQATQNLEAGAGGLMAARIESAEQAEEFVRWVKFPPRGRRGLNVNGRDGHYGGMTLQQFTQKSNAENTAIIQIETLGALEQADQIAAIDGVDALFVGPSDMSLELNVLGQYENETLWSAYARVASACRRHGKQWGTIAVNPAFARRAADMGCRLLTFGGDALALRKGIEAFKHSFAEFFG